MYFNSKVVRYAHKTKIHFVFYYLLVIQNIWLACYSSIRHELAWLLRPLQNNYYDFRFSKKSTNLNIKQQRKQQPQNLPRKQGEGTNSEQQDATHATKLCRTSIAVISAWLWVWASLSFPSVRCWEGGCQTTTRHPIRTCSVLHSIVRSP